MGATGVLAGCNLYYYTCIAKAFFPLSASEHEYHERGRGTGYVVFLRVAFVRGFKLLDGYIAFVACLVGRYIPPNRFCKAVSFNASTLHFKDNTLFSFNDRLRNLLGRHKMPRMSAEMRLESSGQVQPAIQSTSTLFLQLTDVMMI